MHHFKTIRYITIKDQLDPHYWITTRWCENIVFERCNFGCHSIVNPRESTTRILSFIHCYGTIDLGWEQLKVLKELRVYYHDPVFHICIKNIRNCTSLEKIYIRENLDNEKNMRSISSLFLYIDNLKILVYSNKNIEKARIFSYGSGNKIKKIILTNQ